jgi:hypothetical protein
MKKLHAIIALVALASASTLLAQTTDGSGKRGPHRGGPRGGGHAIVLALDADKDGEISATELANAKTALAALDKNGDGNVTMDEMRPARPANAPTPPAGATAPTGGRTRPSGGTSGDMDSHPIDPVMLALDANKDGALSSGEINNAVASLKVLDANSDGKLTRDELRPLPPVKS